jgi:hypothetical protein
LIVSHIAFLFVRDNSILFPLWYSPSILILIIYGVCNWFHSMYFFQHIGKWTTLFFFLAMLANFIIINVMLT